MKTWNELLIQRQIFIVGGVREEKTTECPEDVSRKNVSGQRKCQ
jgi:hypothetical protein